MRALLHQRLQHAARRSPWLDGSRRAPVEAGVPPV